VLTHALGVMQAAYKRGRKPLVELPRGVRVVLSKKAAEAMKAAEHERLVARAQKNRWTLRLPQRLEQSQGMGL